MALYVIKVYTGYELFGEWFEHEPITVPKVFETIDAAKSYMHRLMNAHESNVKIFGTVIKERTEHNLSGYILEEDSGSSWTRQTKLKYRIEETEET